MPIEAKAPEHLTSNKGTLLKRALPLPGATSLAHPCALKKPSCPKAILSKPPFYHPNPHSEIESLSSSANPHRCLNSKP